MFVSLFRRRAVSLMATGSLTVTVSLFATVALTVILLAGFTGLGASSAAASERGTTATPSTDSDHDWPTDGCTGVPDRIVLLMDFNHACDHHDGCYSDHWRSRWGCDVRFFIDMEHSCTEKFHRWSPSRELCRSVRDTYFVGVRVLGYPAYHDWSFAGRLQ